MAITEWREFRPLSALAVDSKWEDAMSKKPDAAIDALVDALAELPEHELEGWQHGNRLGVAHPMRPWSALSRHRAGAASRREQSRRFFGSRRAGGRCFVAPREKRHDAQACREQRQGGENPPDYLSGGIFDSDQELCGVIAPNSCYPLWTTTKPASHTHSGE